MECFLIKRAFLNSSRKQLICIFQMQLEKEPSRRPLEMLTGSNPGEAVTTVVGQIFECDNILLYKSDKEQGFQNCRSVFPSVCPSTYL